MLALFLLASLSDPIPAKVIRVVDGDSVVVEVESWKNTPFSIQSVRISGIDTPESRKPPGKCVAETKLGKKAQAFARTLAKPGDDVTFVFHSIDKYGGRIDADIILSDGRDWAHLMLSEGYAKSYDGGTKMTWCPVRKKKATIS